MRLWLFHPVIFYPLVLLIAAGAIFASLEPQNWPRDPAPAAATHQGASLVWTRTAFDAPDVAPGQNMTVVRSLWGDAQTLRIAVLPNQAPPGPQDSGVRILLTQADSAALSAKPAVVEISYNPLPINAATGLAVSVEGAGATQWVSQAAASPPQGPLKFEIPPQTSPHAIGLRVLSTDTHEAFGLEITRIKITPHA